MSKSVTASLAAVMAVILIVAGCGGGGDDPSTDSTATTTTTSSSSTGSISKAEFIKQADAVCTSGGKRTTSEFSAYIKKNEIPAKPGPTASQFAAIRSQILVPALERQAGELRALEVPAGDEAEVSAYLDAVEEGLEKVEEGEAKVVVESTPKLLAKADGLAGEYGFKVCGQH